MSKRPPLKYTQTHVCLNSYTGTCTVPYLYSCLCEHSLIHYSKCCEKCMKMLHFSTEVKNFSVETALSPDTSPSRERHLPKLHPLSAPPPYIQILAMPVANQWSHVVQSEYCPSWWWETLFSSVIMLTLWLWCWQLTQLVCYICSRDVHPWPFLGPHSRKRNFQRSSSEVSRM